MADFYKVTENYEDLIHKYGQSTKINTLYLNLKKFGTEKQLEEFIKNNNIKETYDRDYAIYELIFNYTLPHTSRDKLENLSNWVIKYDSNCNISIMHNNSFNTNELVLKTTDYEIKAITFSSINSEIKQMFPKLETINRANFCFDDSLELATKLGMDCNLVTGTVKGIIDKADFLHSWVETNINGEEVVIDYTMNAIINKEGYYKFRHAKALEKINVDDIFNDSEKYGKIFNLLNIKASMYNLFRDEIINDFERNNYEEIVKK